MSDMQTFYADATIDVSLRVEAETMEEAKELVEGGWAPWHDDTPAISVWEMNDSGVEVYEITQPILTGDCEADGVCSCRCHDKEGSSK